MIDFEFLSALCGSLQLGIVLYQYSISEDKSLAGQLRDLGVIVSNDQSWTPRIKAIANKAP